MEIDNYAIYDFALALYELMKKHKVNTQQVNQALAMIDKKKGEKADEVSEVSNKVS